MFRAGIDLGGTNIKAGIVDENQKILAEGSVPTRVERPYEEIVNDMAVLKRSVQMRVSYWALEWEVPVQWTRRVVLCYIPTILTGTMCRLWQN